MTQPISLDRRRLHRSAVAFAVAQGVSGRATQFAEGLQQLADEIVACMISTSTDAHAAAEAVARRRGVCMVTEAGDSR